jgi:DNA-directed RNA polymerase specialized sigma24 family protein
VPPLQVSQIEWIFRAEYGRAVAVLTRVFGDIDIAENAAQDAFTTAMQRWPSDGLPPSPAGWIITTARNRAIYRLRREATREDRHAQAALLRARDEPAEEVGARGREQMVLGESAALLELAAATSRYSSGARRGAKLAKSHWPHRCRRTALTQAISTLTIPRWKVATASAFCPPACSLPR